MPPKSAVPCCNCGVNLPPRRAKGPNSGILRRRGIKSRVNTTDTALEVLTREFGFQESEYDAELWLCPNCFAAVKTLAQGRKVFTDRACTQSIFEVAKPSENVSPKSKEKDSEPPQKKQKKEAKPGYKNYSEKNLKKAYFLVMHKKTSIRKAALRCGVPQQTLGCRVRKGSFDAVGDVGHPTVFTKEEEERISTFIEKQAAIGYELNRPKLIEIASNYAIRLQKAWVKNKPTKTLTFHWVDSFLKRWPNVRLLTKISVTKTRMTSTEVISQYYKELEQILDKHELKDKPERIYNLDETTFSIESNHPSAINHKSPNPKEKAAPKGSVTTVIATANAIGNVLPPFFIFNGQRWNEDLGKGAFPGAKFKVSESGQSTTDILDYYLKEHFMKCVPQDGKPNLLLYDGHAANVGISLIEWAKEKNLTLFVIPPHSSRLLQTSDAVKSKPLHIAYNQAAQEFEDKCPGEVVNRYNICQVLSQAYSTAMTPENIIASFQNGGLVTLSPFPCESGSLLTSAITVTVMEEEEQIDQTEQIEQIDQTEQIEQIDQTEQMEQTEQTPT